MTALQHDDIRPALAGLDILLVHRLYGGKVLADHRFQGAAALPDVPHDAAQDAFIGIGIHKNLDVHFVGQLRIGKDEDALHDDDLGGAHLLGAVGAVVDGIIIHRTMDGMPRLEGAQVLDEQRGIEGIWVVVVEQLALFEGQLIMAFIVAVVVQHADIRPEIFLQLFGDGGFAAAGAPRDADDHRVHSVSLPRFFLHFITFRQASQRQGGTFCAGRQKTLDLRQGNMVQ